MQLFAGELFLDDTSRLDSRSQHVLLGGEVFRLADSVHFVEVAEKTNKQKKRKPSGAVYTQTAAPPSSFSSSQGDSLAGRVVQLVLSSSVEGGLHAGVLPQLLDDVGQLGGHRAFLDGVRQVLQLLGVLLRDGRRQKKR